MVEMMEYLDQQDVKERERNNDGDDKLMVDMMEH